MLNLRGANKSERLWPISRVLCWPPLVQVLVPLATVPARGLGGQVVALLGHRAMAFMLKTLYKRFKTLDER